ncbi:radical SAM protein [Paenibacillus sp. FSL R5-0475]|uniref:radical SAM protein n=1 Tax=Paenibacillus sp. FSL R5-0475 TaxID=2921643 RepID=UPI0030FC9D4D
MSNLVNVAENHNEILKFKELFVNLKKEFRFSRLGKPFRTSNCNYFLDSGTGKVFMLNENTYRVLECLWNTDEFERLFELEMSSEELLNGLKEVEEAVKSENILQLPPVEKMYLFDGKVFYDKDAPNVQTEQITFEMTERCNLRCKYCIYHEGEAGFRSFGSRDIDLDTCKKAIDMLSKSTKEEVYVTFYGGEPLLRFDIMRDTIEYSKVKLHNKKVFYNMTTNATLMTEEIANYWTSLENHSTLVSLDGPEWMHDKNRVYCNGKGSFKSVIRGLKKLVEAEGTNAAAKISYNIVITDARMETLEKIQHFFRNSEHIPAGSSISTSYLNTPPEKLSYLGVGTEEDRQLCESLMKRFDPLTKWSVDKLNSDASDIDDKSLISKDSYDKALSKVHNRMRRSEPIEAFAMNGCCIPGGRRLYITVNGDLAICEKMGPSPFIGTVHEGIDYEKINKHYIADFMNEATKYCNDCWAVNTCSLCYLQCFDSDGIDMSYRQELCVINRVHTEQSLVLYHEMLEKNPESLAYLNEITYK